jgi:hypothetical protein
MILAPRIAMAQETKGQTAPYVSRLKAEAVGFQVKLTWEDPPGTAGTVIVYRAAEEITAARLAEARLLDRMPTGQGYYADTPPDRGTYFYAVLVQGPDGAPNPLLVPFRNKTAVGVAVRAAAAEESVAAVVTGIKAEVSNNGQGIEVSFRLSTLDRDLLLFWGSAPISTEDDLLRSTAKTQLDAGTTRYTFPSLPGVDIWFAVLDAGLYKVGEAPVKPGENATTDPVQIPLEAGGAALPAVDNRRPQPLPSLAIDFGVRTGDRITGGETFPSPSSRELSVETDSAIAWLMREAGKIDAPEMKPRVLPFDRTPSPGGELSLLEGIVQGPFASGDMGAAQRLLLDFLSLRRATEVEARARFYLGQVYYFQDKVREGLLEFLTAEGSFYHETEPWKNACIRRLEEDR